MRPTESEISRRMGNALGLPGAHAHALLPAAQRAASAELRYEPFPVNVLPEPIRTFVVNGAAAFGCDPSFIALPLLSALAAAIGNTYRIRLKDGWSEPAILWTAIVGESGTLKTPAFKLALKPLRAAQAAAFREYAAAIAEWEPKYRAYELELAAWRKKAAKNSSLPAPEKPAPPVARRYIVSDATVEALVPILLANPRGVLQARDELAGWVGAFDRYAKTARAGGDVSTWLSMHGGDSVTVDRKTGIPPTLHVPAALVSVTGGIQPGTLARVIGPEHHENGLLARLLFAMPPRRVKRWSEADVDPSAEAAVGHVFRFLLALEAETTSDGEARPHVLTMDTEAKRAWIDFYNQHASELADLTGDGAAAWSKLEGGAARFALIIHLVREAARDPALANSGRIDAASIAAGVELSRWFGREALRVYATFGESEDDRAVQELLGWIDRRGGTVTARDVAKGMRGYRDNPQRAEAMLEALVKAGSGGWVNVAGDDAGGRPTRRFRLNPAMRVPETPSKPEDSDGFGDSDGHATPAAPAETLVSVPDEDELWEHL